MNNNPFPPHSASQRLAQALLRLMSWKLEVTIPPTDKFVLVGAPHTSNWDLFYALLLMYGAGIRMHWIGKDSLFHWPLNGLMRRLGGIPVVRHARGDFVAQIVTAFNEAEKLIIAIAPEGTRSKIDHWKSGFYYIAQGAGVPICLGYIDYPRKMVGIGPCFYPSGDIQADFLQIKEFYASKGGIHPHLQGPIRLESG